MSSLFCRINTDRSETDVLLENMFAGGSPAACWLIGGGPSFDQSMADLISVTPAPRMCINLAGAGLIRPNFWTSYDPSMRFHKSIYLDPSVMKFVHKRRSLDLVPESSFKVCDCPNLYFFERHRDRQFVDFVASSHTGIVDWSDSMMQSIDILYRLGFRIIYLVGCEMMVRPSEAQQERAEEKGVGYEPQELLKGFLKRCEEKGLSTDELEAVERERQYHFVETKPLRAAANADSHYFRMSQYLRLCRRAMSLAGLQLISVTPESRLNDYFPCLGVEEAVMEIHQRTGNPTEETTEGLYQQLTDRRGNFQGPMRDFRTPVNLSMKSRKEPPKPAGGNEFLVEAEGFEDVDELPENHEYLQKELNEMKRNRVEVVEGD
ncbi:MAG: hypothetical protein KDA65_14660 [Planctomycetaceae bacterium]|nr:hypothetical protein [Planctomycetaceae bacterium]